MYDNTDSVTLKNNIPIIQHFFIDLLSINERQMSKFFKCFPKESIESIDSIEKCFWAGNRAHEFKDHIQSCHQYVFCSYCLSDNATNNQITCKPFAAEDVDLFIKHLIESHGRRVFQCNRCQYRASTLTHLQMHQISTHYRIWSKHNRTIRPETLCDLIDDILKIIVCKPIIENYSIDHLKSVSQHFPDLDSKLSEELFYCQFCEYSNEKATQVFMHCTHKHRDLEVCAFHKEDTKKYCLESDSEPETIDSDNSDSDEPTPQPINGSKNLVNNFESLLSLNSDPTIPGINEGFVEVDTTHNTFNSRKSSAKRHQQRFEERGHKSYDKRGNKRKESFDSIFEDDYEHSCPPNDDFMEPNTEYNPQMIRPLFNIEPPFPSYFVPQSSNTFSPVEQPLTPTPQPLTPIPQPLSSTPQPTPPTRQQTLQRKKDKKWGKFKLQNLKSNERLSEMSYGEYRQQQQQNKALQALTSTQTSSGVSPSTDSQIGSKQTESESNFRNNSFKQINRVGRVGAPTLTDNSNKPKITYIRRDDDETDEYLELLNRNVPKRGVKARFENQKHFELTPLSGTRVSGQGLYKCVICPNELQLRENNISLHLKGVHNTNSSLKCGFCEFMGDKQQILSHSRVVHPNMKPDVSKFIVPISQNASIGLTSGITVEKTKTVARKSTGGASKGSKGALTQKIRDSTYMGPLKNDVTQRKETDLNDPSKRVYSRSPHSSIRRSQKRPKLYLSSSDSECEHKMPSEDYFASDEEMPSDTASADEHNYYDSDEEIERLSPIKKVSVAKKSTAKASSSQNDSQLSITLTEEQIPTQYFCVFCTDSFNNKWEAIEHYKCHLNLGYNCGKCDYFSISYSSIDNHWKNVHKSEEMDISDNMCDFILKWINAFLDDQIKCADFAEAIAPNSTGINIECALCIKAATICESVRARSFDALWKIKLHICKHLNWFPMKCALCEDSDTMFPQNPYLLMKHLIDFHFTSCDNLYNISFRGQKPFNDMKREQLRIIEKNFLKINVYSSDIINSFFHQLMTELDMEYENQLKAKYNLPINKEVQINVQRMIQVKPEPIDEYVVNIDETQPQESEAQESDPKTEVKDEDKKDIKLNIKTEFKTELKTEFKTEIKNECKKEEEKEEQNNEVNEDMEEEEEEEEDIRESGVQFLSRLYGDDEVDPIPSCSGLKRKASNGSADIIDLSSDEDI